MITLCEHARSVRRKSQQFPHEPQTHGDFSAEARHYSLVRRAGVWVSTVATVAILGGICLVGLGMSRAGFASAVRPTADPVSEPSAPTPATPPPSRTPSRAELAARVRAANVKALNAALKKYAATVPEFSVAVLDRRTGALYSFRAAETYETASIVKVQVLA